MAAYLLIFIAALFSPIGIDLYLGVSPYFLRDINWDPSLVFSAFLGGVAMGHLISGRLYDQFGPKCLFFIACACGVGSGLLQIMAVSEVVFLLTRGLQGVSAAFFLIFATTYIQELVKKEDLDKHYARLNGSMNVIPATFPAIGLMVWQADASTPWVGVSAVWILLCFVTACWGWFGKLPGKPQQTPFVRSATTAEKRPVEFYRFAWLAIGSLTGLFMYCAAVFPILTLHYQLSNSMAAIYFAGNGAIMFAAGWLSGRKKGRSPSPILRSAALLSCAAILLALSQTLDFGAGHFMIACSIFCLGFIPTIAHSHAGAMRYISVRKGEANGFIAWWQMILGAAATAILGLFTATEQEWLLAGVFGGLAVYSILLHRSINDDQFSQSKPRPSKL